MYGRLAMPGQFTEEESSRYWNKCSYLLRLWLRQSGTFPESVCPNTERHLEKQLHGGIFAITENEESGAGSQNVG